MVINGETNLRKFICELDGERYSFVWKDLVEEFDIELINFTSAEELFCNTDFEVIDLEGMNTSQVTNMSSIFENCQNLSYVSLKELDCSKVVSMKDMFLECPNLKEADLSTLELKSVRDLSGMFYECTNLRSISFQTSGVIRPSSMRDMFSGCLSLAEIDLSRFDTGDLKENDCASNFIEYCDSLSKVTLGMQQYSSEVLKTLSEAKNVKIERDSKEVEIECKYSIKDSLNKTSLF